MTKTQLESYRRSLLALRRRCNGDASHLADEALRKNGAAGAGSPTGMPIHMADLGTDNFEQEFTLNLLHNQEQVLEEIGEALERIKDGTFGRCEECEGAIPRARLDALPYARLCIACARKREQKP